MTDTEAVFTRELGRPVRAPSPRRFSRRTIVTMAVGAVGAALLWPAVFPRAFAAGQDQHRKVQPKKIVALDWTIAETLLALGVIPLGTVSVDAYRQWVAIPLMPKEVVDVGLVSEPNLELLQELSPDLIVGRSQTIASNPLLTKIAPFLQMDIYGGTEGPYGAARRETIRLAGAIGRETDGQALLDAADIALQDARNDLHSYRGTQLLIVSFIDATHVKIYGRNSLFGDVLRQLGLVNAWRAPTDYWGMAIVGLADLAAASNATIIYIEPVPHRAQVFLETSPLWKSLSFVRHGRVIGLPVIWTFGGVSSAERFAGLLANHEAATGAAHG